MMYVVYRCNAKFIRQIELVCNPDALPLQQPSGTSRAEVLPLTWPKIDFRTELQ